MGEDGRRPGDWQRREEREAADDLVRSSDELKWYDQTFWIVFFLVVFCPVGLVLMWRTGWNVVVKAVVTLFVVAAVCFNFAMVQTVQQMHG